VSGQEPAEFSLMKDTKISIHNACVDSQGDPFATTLSCDQGLFAPEEDFPMSIGAGETVYAHVQDATNKEYYYTDSSTPELGTRAGRIKV
jgi:hypothetical protein